MRAFDFACASKGQRVGLDVSALERAGLRVAGLYLGSAADGGGPRPGAFEVEKAFVRDADGRAVYWFDAPDSDIVVYCVVAKAGGRDPYFSPSVITSALPGAVQGGFYRYQVAAVGSPGTRAWVTGLPKGLKADGLLISGVPQKAGSFEVTVGLEGPTGVNVFGELVLEVAPGEQSTVGDGDGNGNSVTGYVPGDAELVVKDSPFGEENMRAAADALGWGAIEAGSGGAFHGTSPAGGKYTLVPVVAVDAGLALGGEALPVHGPVGATFAFGSLPDFSGLAKGARASLIALHAGEDGLQVAQSEGFVPGELLSRLASSVKLSAAASDMSGSVSYVSGKGTMSVYSSNGMSPFALYLKVEEGRPGPAPVPEQEPAAKPLAHTGDAAPLAPLAALAAVSGALLAAGILGRKRER